MRSYGQYCGLAKALDLVGDRWSLLIVRELLLRDGLRYTDLRDGLPGIATNLLADRLRDLEEAGVVQREDAPPPVATTLFRLTERGRELRPAVHALGHWGGPMLADDFGDDAFRSHWLALPLEIHLGDRALDGPPATIGVHAGGEDLLVELGHGRVRTREWDEEVPEVTITAPPRLMLGLLMGMFSIEFARERGLEIEGDDSVLRRVLGEDEQEAVATAR